ncbi:MAG: hypothetical protein U9R08_03500 [Nanoarchaeota archaeon]|nr:hypothetical protein [Nanoarchaeota archaeon]
MIRIDREKEKEIIQATRNWCKPNNMSENNAEDLAKWAYNKGMLDTLDIVERARVNNDMITLGGLHKKEWEEIMWLLDNHTHALAKIKKWQIQKRIDMAIQNGEWR